MYFHSIPILLYSLRTSSTSRETCKQLYFLLPLRPWRPFGSSSRRAREPEGGGGVSPRGCRAGRPGSPSGKPKPQGGQRPPWGFVRAARARRPPPAPGPAPPNAPPKKMPGACRKPTPGRKGSFIPQGSLPGSPPAAPQDAGAAQGQEGNTSSQRGSFRISGLRGQRKPGVYDGELISLPVGGRGITQGHVAFFHRPVVAGGQAVPTGGPAALGRKPYRLPIGPAVFIQLHPYHPGPLAGMVVLPGLLHPNGIRPSPIRGTGGLGRRGGVRRASGGRLRGAGRGGLRRLVGVGNGRASGLCNLYNAGIEQAPSRSFAKEDLCTAFLALLQGDGLTLFAGEGGGQAALKSVLARARSFPNPCRLAPLMASSSCSFVGALGMRRSKRHSSRLSWPPPDCRKWGMYRCWQGSPFPPLGNRQAFPLGLAVAGNIIDDRLLLHRINDGGARRAIFRQAFKHPCPIGLGGQGQLLARILAVCQQADHYLYGLLSWGFSP